VRKGTAFVSHRGLNRSATLPRQSRPPGHGGGQAPPQALHRDGRSWFEQRDLVHEKPTWAKAMQREWNSAGPERRFKHDPPRGPRRARRLRRPGRWIRAGDADRPTANTTGTSTRSITAVGRQHRGGEAMTWGTKQHSAAPRHTAASAAGVAGSGRGRGGHEPEAGPARQAHRTGGRLQTATSG